METYEQLTAVLGNQENNWTVSVNFLTLYKGKSEEENDLLSVLCCLAVVAADFMLYL
jgi:hypothetical protein